MKLPHLKMAAGGANRMYLPEGMGLEHAMRQASALRPFGRGEGTSHFPRQRCRQFLLTAPRPVVPMCAYASCSLGWRLLQTTHVGVLQQKKLRHVQ